MCLPAEKGGAKCVTHTKPLYTDLIALMDAAATKAPFGKDTFRAKARQSFTATCLVTGEALNATNVLADHASTTHGAKQIAADVERYAAEGDAKTKTVLTTALRLGKERLAEAKAAKTVFEKVERAARGSKATLVEHRGSFATSLAGRYPDFVAAGYWTAEHNQGITAERIAAKSNAGVTLLCPEGHLMEHRLNNVMNIWDKGRKPHCNECAPRRQASFKALQGILATDLVSALGGNAKNFETLSPALRYGVMSALGLTTGVEDSLRKQVAMGIVHGDYTLAEVCKASDLSKIEKKIKDRGEDDDALALVDENTADTNAASHWRHKPVDLASIIASAGAASLIDPNESQMSADMIQGIVNEKTEQMWEMAYRETGDCLTTEQIDAKAIEFLSQFCIRIDKQREAEIAKGTYLALGYEIADQFTQDLLAVIDAGLPAPYVTEQNQGGVTRLMHPTLAQRRFAHMMLTERCVANWSDTGAGKTISAILGLAASGVTSAFVLGPKAVGPQWVDAIRDAIPGAVVHMGLPGEDGHVTAFDTNPADTLTVWVANYDRFSGKSSDLRERIAQYAGRVEAVILDEVHKVKAKDDTATSSRRRNLESFLDQAREINPDLMVVGMSATPVVTCLSEAKSVLRLVRGQGAASFQTKPNARNAAAAHLHIADVGIRHLPTYRTAFRRVEETIDISANIAAVKNALETICKDSEATSARAESMPSYLERALLPEKIPAVLAHARQAVAERNPLLVYTHYREGMIEPMVEALNAEGIRVATLHGSHTTDERSATLARFAAGEFDVLIGTSTIGTGVDGLQHICNNMLVVSMPWTSADDDQLLGRLHRRGQERDVTVTYLLTEAQVGGTRWSFCKTRQKRVSFRRDIGAAAVDGILPDGMLEDGAKATESAMAALRALPDVA